VGYKESADIAKKAISTGASVREVLRGTGLFSDEEIERLLDPETMV
jgi:aspartate ammonia-lyase